MNEPLIPTTSKDLKGIKTNEKSPVSEGYILCGSTDITPSGWEGDLGVTKGSMREILYICILIMVVVTCEKITQKFT